MANWLAAVQVIELLAEHLGQWACSIAFPELAHLPLLHLRRFAKQCKVERFRTFSRALADALERNMAYVAQRRQQVDFSPKDTAQVNAFLKQESEAKQVSHTDLSVLLHSLHGDITTCAYTDKTRSAEDDNNVFVTFHSISCFSVAGEWFVFGVRAMLRSHLQ